MFKRQFLVVFTLICGLVTGELVWAKGSNYKSKQLRNFDFGVFCTKIPMDRIPAPETVEGWIHAPNRMTAFHWKTQIVPASKSIAFGVRASAKTANILDAEIIVTHPQIKGRSQDRWKTNFRTNKLTLDFYSFEFAHEMKPGNWVMKAVKDGVTLYQARFKVVRASKAHDIVKSCSRR